MRAAAAKMQREAQERRWQHDPVAWAEDVLGIVMWSKQKEILRAVVQHKRVAVKSSHSIGKTFICAVAACWWISTHEDCMVQSTAPTYQQVHSLLWEEIRKMHMRANLKGRVILKDQWLVPLTKQGRTQDTLVGEGKKPADSNIHGFHGTHRPDGVFTILDEGCGIAQSIFTGAEAITTAAFDRTLTVGNPDDPNTEFGAIFRENDPKLFKGSDKKPKWHLITVSAFDTPNFTGEDKALLEWADEYDRTHGGTPDSPRPQRDKVERMLGGLPQPTTVEDQKQLWGEDSPRYLSKVLAQFPLTSVDSLFSASEIETGRVNIIEPSEMGFKVLGVDVARYGSDRTVVAYNCEGHIEILGSYNTMDTMEVAANVHKLAVDRKVDQVRVDGVGVGGGVVDRLVQLSRSVDMPYVVIEMTASASPPDRTLHRNSRAYWYDSLKHQLRNALIDLPDDGATSDGETLIRELGSIRYMYPNGVLQIESKEDIRRRGDKSPDYVDAVVMATAPINYIKDDPLATMRPGQMLEIDVLDSIELVSLF
jgi:hypothetical protein